jgi:hypothetical protein
MALAEFTCWTPAKLREKSRSAIDAAKKEPNLHLKQALAEYAFDMAQHAEKIERAT